MSGVESRFIDAGGVKTHYLEAGTGEPVVLLHGSGPGTTAAAWTSLIAALAPRFEVVAPDLLGFGASPRPSGPLRAAWTAQALAHWSDRSPWRMAN